MSAAELSPVETLSADDLSLSQAVGHFLTREAWLLDHERYDAWLDLFDPDVRYYAPVRASVNRTSNEGSGEGRLSHFDETIQTLTMRAKRLATGQAWAEDPRSRIRRFVSSPVLLAQDGDELTVGSNILIHREAFDERPHQLSAYREDRLRRNAEGNLRIKARTIWIDHLTLRPLTVFL
jgi:3-phenylpropionate/cinnamic acid dioxygenase small subunit